MPEIADLVAINIWKSLLIPRALRSQTYISAAMGEFPSTVNLSWWGPKSLPSSVSSVCRYSVLIDREIQKQIETLLRYVDILRTFSQPELLRLFISRPSVSLQDESMQSHERG